MSGTANYLTMDELEAGLEKIRQSPRDEGILKLIVRRPQTNEREVLQEGALTVAEGLVGDKWKNGNSRPEMQLTLMNVRVIELLAQEEAHWPLAGDQLF